MAINKLIGFLAMALLAGQLATGQRALAETVDMPVSARADSPQQYIVKSGDSLWKIADLFLQDPWRWPSIWQNNSQIDNPHLIYPGDVIALINTADGLRLVVNPQTSGDLNLSPTVISESLEQAIPVIPLHEIAQFLERSTVIDSSDKSDYPYVLSGVGEHVVTGAGDQVYVRKLAEGDTFDFFRLGTAYTDSATDELLGHAALFIGSGALITSGDPAKLLITQSRREILPGDVVVPQSDEVVEPNFNPRPADQSINARIIDVVDGVSQIGQYNVVVIDRGSADGMEVGHTLRVFSSPPEIYDTQASEWIGVPDEHIGTLLVFKSFDRVSFGLIMSSTAAIEVGDKAVGGAG